MAVRKVEGFDYWVRGCCALDGSNPSEDTCQSAQLTDTPETKRMGESNTGLILGIAIPCTMVIIFLLIGWFKRKDIVAAFNERKENSISKTSLDRGCSNAATTQNIRADDGANDSDLESSCQGAPDSVAGLNQPNNSDQEPAAEQGVEGRNQSNDTIGEGDAEHSSVRQNSDRGNERGNTQLDTPVEHEHGTEHASASEALSNLHPHAFQAMSSPGERRDSHEINIITNIYNINIDGNENDAQRESQRSSEYERANSMRSAEKIVADISQLNDELAQVRLSEQRRWSLGREPSTEELSDRYNHVANMDMVTTERRRSNLSDIGNYYNDDASSSQSGTLDHDDATNTVTAGVDTELPNFRDDGASDGVDDNAMESHEGTGPGLNQSDSSAEGC